MRVLIVEDDPFKLDDIQRVIEKVPCAVWTPATSLHSAMTALEQKSFEFVVLDMAIPSHTSDAGAADTYSQPVGGLDVLLFLASAERREQVAILTQHPTVEYDRRHVPLNKLIQILQGDGVTNVRAAIWFTEGKAWEGLLLDAMGVPSEHPAR